jgi:hypothetical protein
VSRPGRSLPPGNTRYPLCRRLGGPQGRFVQVRKISSPSVFNPRTVQPVASRYTDYAINMYVIYTICSNKLATLSVCEFTDPRSLYLPTLLLCNILATFRHDHQPTCKQCLLLPYTNRRTKQLERQTITPQMFSGQTFQCSQKSEKCRIKLYYTINKPRVILPRPRAVSTSRLYRLKLTPLRQVAPPIH